MPAGDNQMREDKTLETARAIASMVGVDIEVVKVSDVRLEVAIDKMVVAEVVMQYTLLDELLGEIIVQYFFDVDPDAIHYGGEWRGDKFRIFVHHMLDEMFLLKKKDVAHAIEPLPSEMNKILQRINAVRNSLAHSFFPENRKEYRKSGKVLYADKDIR